MLPDPVSNPGPLTYESGALPIALRGPARSTINEDNTAVGEAGPYNEIGLSLPKQPKRSRSVS